MSTKGLDDRLAAGCAGEDDGVASGNSTERELGARATGLTGGAWRVAVARAAWIPVALLKVMGQLRANREEEGEREFTCQNHP
jgi:hypothetical protein